MAVKFGMSPSMEARFGRAATDAEQGGFSYQRFAPNFRQPFGHRHRDQEEFYVVLSGSGQVTLEGETQPIRQWDAIRVAPQTARGFEAGDDGLELLVFGAGDGEGGGDARELLGRARLAGDLRFGSVLAFRAGGRRPPARRGAPRTGIGRSAPSPPAPRRAA